MRKLRGARPGVSDYGGSSAAGWGLGTGRGTGTEQSTQRATRANSQTEQSMRSGCSRVATQVVVDGGFGTCWERGGVEVEGRPVGAREVSPEAKSGLDLGHAARRAAHTQSIVPIIISSVSTPGWLFNDNIIILFRCVFYSSTTSNCSRLRMPTGLLTGLGTVCTCACACACASWTPQTKPRQDGFCIFDVDRGVR